jgi:hypothetical protein
VLPGQHQTLQKRKEKRRNGLKKSDKIQHNPYTEKEKLVINLLPGNSKQTERQRKTTKGTC